MLDKTVEYIRSITDLTPEIGIILGSGLGDFAETIYDKIVINYEDIPGFSKSQVKGHNSRLVFGTVADVKVVAMQGRMHYYEGHTIGETVYPIRVLKALGVEKLIITNASGGINTDYTPGDIVMIKDHINLTGINPLIGPSDEDRRFISMMEAYSPQLMDKAEKVAEELNMDVKKGTYMYFTGPNYETPAEIKAAAVLGADCVGMSTVPEVIQANYEGMKVLGLTCITNMAAGIGEQFHDHGSVIEVSARVQDVFSAYVKRIISVI
ncbi:MAG: purine-nucleoside phosphorylase [Peptoniphilus sp.]|nr:purine-nucleoside phosphorylase [Peptoniphilus sp.]